VRRVGRRLLRDSFVPTHGEELANTATHGLGALLALAGTVFLVRKGVNGGAGMAGAGELVSYIVFGLALVSVYLSSSLYHGVPVGRAKQFLRRVDHAAIMFLIAGTYTPFCVLGLPGTAGTVILTLEWLLAGVGITLAIFFRRYSKAWQQVAFVALYLAMGWMILPSIGTLSQVLAPEVVWWTLAGGVAYTLGVVFFAMKRVRYAHGIWHLFVMAGSASHFVAIYGYL
jgi:hemolysin III